MTKTNKPPKSLPVEFPPEINGMYQDHLKTQPRGKSDEIEALQRKLNQQERETDKWKEETRKFHKNWIEESNHCVKSRKQLSDEHIGIFILTAISVLVIIIIGLK